MMAMIFLIQKFWNWTKILNSLNIPISKILIFFLMVLNGPDILDFWNSFICISLSFIWNGDNILKSGKMVI